MGGADLLSVIDGMPRRCTSTVRRRGTRGEGEAMSFLAVVFVVLMILCLFGGGYGYRQGPGPWVWGGLMLWICVAILGYILLGGGPGPPMR